MLVRYSKLGPARFTSARDVARLMERALKRAGVPVAYSSGFSPHQRVSYAFPAPTGAASHSEYALIALSEPFDAAQVEARLNTALPAGLQVVVAATNDRQLAGRLVASQWRMRWPGQTPDGGPAAVAGFLAESTVLVERRAKSGTSLQDVRAAVVSMAWQGDELAIVLRQGEPLIRPGDVAAGLTKWYPQIPNWGSPLLTRRAQGALVRDDLAQALVENLL